MSCCVGQASLGVHLTVCVVCYAAEDWPVFNNVILARNRQLPDDDRMLETYHSIFKTFNVNNLSVCIGWCADQVTLFSLFHFPMPLASTAHNIILPLENVRIRYLLLRSLHCKIASGC